MEHWETVLGVVLGLILLLGGMQQLEATTNALEDPDNKSVVLLSELPSLILIDPERIVELTIYRQSGNVHSSWQPMPCRLAVKELMTTFRRAKIDAVRIRKNDASILDVARAFYSHRGSAEGKKVGSALLLTAD